VNFENNSTLETRTEITRVGVYYTHSDLRILTIDIQVQIC